MGRIIPTFTAYNWGIVMLMALGTTSVSYSLSSISGALGQANFYEYMNLVAVAGEPGYDHTSNFISSTTACLLSGAIIGVCIAGWAADFLGRRLATQLASVVLVIGAAIQAGSVNQGMFLAGRLIAGGGMGGLWTTLPMYQAEVSTPDSRGFMVSMTGVMFALGYMLSGWINFGTYYAGIKDPKSSFAWRFPLAVQLLPALLLFFGSPLLPQSPRWLIEKERPEEALKVLKRLHAKKQDDGDIDEYAKREFVQMSKQIEFDTSVQRELGRFAILKTAANRKRVYLGAGLLWGCQFMGLTVIGTYGVLVYSSLGLTGSIPLLLQGVWVTISLPGNLFTALFVDKVGRRTLLLTGAAAILMCQVILCALEAKYLGTSNKAGQDASVFFIFLMILIWSTCMDATQFVYLSEIFPSHLRAQGQAVGMVSWMLSGIILLVAAPIAMDHIHWRFLLINICCTVVFIACLYFFYPETARLSIEDINALFGDTVVLRFEGATEKELDLYNQEIGHEVNVHEEKETAELRET